MAYKVKLIVAYGDNDIGGEGNDLMTEKVSKYVHSIQLYNITTNLCYSRYIDEFGVLNSNKEIGGIEFIKVSQCYIKL